MSLDDLIISHINITNRETIINAIIDLKMKDYYIAMLICLKFFNNKYRQYKLIISMRSRVTFLIFLCMSLFQIIEAQNIYGIVVDNKNIPIEGVTVIVESLDSIFIEGTITNTLGAFRVKSSPKSYKLKFQHLLYKSKSILIKNNDIGTVSLDNNDYTIGEVVVKGSKPVVKIEDGKMIYNLSSLTKIKWQQTLLMHWVKFQK